MCPYIEQKEHVAVWIHQYIEPNCVYIIACVLVLNQSLMIFFGIISKLNQMCLYQCTCPYIEHKKMILL